MKTKLSDSRGTPMAGRHKAAVNQDRLLERIGYNCRQATIAIGHDLDPLQRKSRHN